MVALKMFEIENCWRSATANDGFIWINQAIIFDI